MTRKEYEQIGALPDAQLSRMSVYETAAVEAHVAQANAADARADAAAALADQVFKTAEVQRAEEVAKILAAAESAVESHRAEAERFRAEAEAARAEIAELQPLVAALGGTELGQKMIRERRQAALLAAREKIDAELKAMPQPASRK